MAAKIAVRKNRKVFGEAIMVKNISKQPVLQPFALKSLFLAKNSGVWRRRNFSKNAVRRFLQPEFQNMAAAANSAAGIRHRPGLSDAGYSQWTGFHASIKKIKSGRLIRDYSCLNLPLF